MPNYLGQIALLVNDYDEAIEFYRSKLNFILLEDTKLTDEKRWVVMKPSAQSQCAILLAKAVGKQKDQIGNQSGGRVFLFLYTDDFDRDYIALVNRGVKFVRDPEIQSYGKVGVFADLYGNLWDLIEPAK